jgi:sugar phosphate isomerase/epimerase
MLNNLPNDSQQPVETNRRRFVKDFAAAAAALAAASTTTIESAAGQQPKKRSARPSCGNQRRWRLAFGLNGFESSEQSFKNNFPIWEVFEFAEREGFEGIEMVPNWPRQGMYLDPADDGRIAKLRRFFAKYNLKIFSIQTFGAEAFQRDRSVREGWVKRFAGLARFAHKAGCECVGYWPGGELGGQTVDQGIDSLVWSLREMGKILNDEELMLGIEIEPPFAFNKIEHMIRILDGADHPRVKAIYDPSHFDVMNGSRGKPHELVERIGVDRIGYIQFTDTDGTLFHGTSKHLPCGDGHIDVQKSLETLWRGGFEGWFMFDAWDTQNPYDACHKGRLAVEAAQRRLAIESNKAR